MNKINTLASIARNYGIIESDSLRDEIVSEYTDKIDSLNTIDESVITKDIELLPVYTIKESNSLKDNMPEKCTKCGSTDIGVFLKGEPIYQCKECGQYLGTAPFKEGYAIDLDLLKSVIESKQLTLEEAIQEIKEANYIGDTFQMYCVLPENINENMSLESFITLNEALNKADIVPIAVNELSRKDWKDVGKEYKYKDRFRFGQTFQNMSDIIKNMFTNPTKTGDFEAIRPRLLRMVDRCKTLDDINYLKRDARAGKVQLTKLKKNKPEIADQIDKHIKWCETDYMDALNKKAKEIKGNK